MEQCHLQHHGRTWRWSHWHVYVEPKIRQRRTETDSWTQRAAVWLPGGGAWERGVGERDWQMQAVTRRVETNKVLLHGTGNQNQDPEINQNGKEYEEDYRHKRVTKLPRCKADVNTTLCKPP